MSNGKKNLIDTLSKPYVGGSGGQAANSYKKYQNWVPKQVPETPPVVSSHVHPIPKTKTHKPFPLRNSVGILPAKNV